MVKAKKKPLSSYQKLESKFLTRMKGLARDDKDIRHIKNSLLKGKNEYLRFDRLESASFDMEWIEKIEDCLPELGQIVNNPKKTIKTVTDVVPIELAKKVNSESLRHLSMNSQFVKSIDKKGNITPEKILNISSDDDYHTYENRFIATVIKRLVLFVEKRYEYLTKHAPFSNTECLYIKNDSVVDGAKVTIETKVRIEKSLTDENVDISNSYLDRVNNIRTYLKYYLNSPFMKLFKAEKAINGQILMTNILRKNPAYHKCYELFRYISSYNKAGENYLIREEFHPFTKKHMEELNNTTLANFLAVSQSEKSKKALAREKRFTPRILNNYDDDLFIFTPTVNKPIEFVRVDEEYNKYLQSLISKELKEKPTKEEFKYDEDEYKKRRKEEAKAKALEKLERRKQKELAKLAKHQEELKEAQRILEEKRLEELKRLLELEKKRRLEEIRKQIRAEALQDKRKEEHELAEKEKARKAAKSREQSKSGDETKSGEETSK